MKTTDVRPDRPDRRVYEFVSIVIGEMSQHYHE